MGSAPNGRGLGAQDASVWSQHPHRPFTVDSDDEFLTTKGEPAFGQCVRDHLGRRPGISVGHGVRDGLRARAPRQAHDVDSQEAHVELGLLEDESGPVEVGLHLTQATRHMTDDRCAPIQGGMPDGDLAPG